MAYPILAPNSTWYKSTQARSTITEINVVDSYTPTSYDEVWNADVNNSGSIKCYRTGTVITMAGNGSGKIAMNADSSFAFALSGGTGFTNLTKITRAGLFDTSNVTTMSRMFQKAGKLIEVDVSKWDTSKVEIMANLFDRTGLTAVAIDNWDVSNVREMNSMFQSCTSLQSLNVSTWDVGRVTTMRNMFYSCQSLNSLDASNWNVGNVTDMRNMFQNCDSLTTLDVSNWDTGKVTGDMDYMFTGMSRLEKITFGENFSFNGDGTCTAAVLPTPDATYITGADGNWYDLDGDAFAPADIPTTTAATYYASKDVCDVNYSINHMTLIDLAKAVRAVTGSTEKLTPGEMATALNSMT